MFSCKKIQLSTTSVNAAGRVFMRAYSARCPVHAIHNAPDRVWVVISLCRQAKHLLMIPHNNVYCESLFSMVRKITTDQRSNLGRGRECHAKSSVYQDCHSFRNTLCGLLTGKINIFKKDGYTCYTWKPEDSLCASMI